MSKLKIPNRNEKIIIKFYQELKKVPGLAVSRTLAERISTSGDTTGTPFYHFRWKIHNLTDFVAYPETKDQVKILLQLANKYNVCVTPRGSGSCYYGSGIPTNGGVVMDMKRMHKYELDKEKLLVKSQPGIVFTHLVDELERKGFSAACYPTSSYTTTLGGWIGTGGTVGVGTLQNGTFMDQIISMTIIDPKGLEKNIEDKKEMAMHFGTGGIFGVVVEVLIKIIPKPPKIIPLSFGFNDRKKMFDAIQVLIKQTDAFNIRFSDKGHEYRSTGFTKYDYYIFILYNGRSNPVEDEKCKCLKLVEELNGFYLGEMYSQRTWDDYLKHEMKIKVENPVLMLQQIYINFDQAPEIIDKFEKLVRNVKINHAYYGLINKDMKTRLVFYTPTDNKYWLHFIASKAALHKLVKYAYKKGGRVYTYGLQNSLYLHKFETKKLADYVKKKIAEDPKNILNPLKVTTTKMSFARINVMFELSYMWRYFSFKIGKGRLILTPKISENY